jgi:hypothetical protein
VLQTGAFVLFVIRVLAALFMLVLLLGVIGIIVPLKFLRLSRRGAALLTLVTFVASLALNVYGFHVAQTMGLVPANKVSSDSAVQQPTKPPTSRVLNTRSDFENSEFCQSYHCKEGQPRTLRNGDTTHDYDTNLREHDTNLSDVSVDLEDNSNRNPAVTGCGLMFFYRDQLSADDFNVIAALVRSTDQTANHRKALSFIKKNIESELACRTCQLDDSTNFVTDGDFRIWAGKVGAEQTLTFERVTHH